jgi:hypothetical protein
MKREMQTNNLLQLTFPNGWKESTVYTFEGTHDSGVQHNQVLLMTNLFHQAN